MNFPFICSNIPAAPVYGVSIYIDMIFKACGSYQDFLDRGLLLTRKLLNRGFLLVKLKLSLRKFYRRHHDLVNPYGISVSQMTTDMFHFSLALPGHFLICDLGLVLIDLFMCMSGRSLFVLLYFFFWPLCCLSFDIWIMITHLASSSSSYKY